MVSPTSSGRASPVKSVLITRGNNRVTRSGQLSPAKHRFLSPKHKDAIKASRKPSNPLDLPPSRLKHALPPATQTEEDEWQDLDEKARNAEAKSPYASNDANKFSLELHVADNQNESPDDSAIIWPELRPPSPIEHSSFLQTHDSINATDDNFLSRVSESTVKRDLEDEEKKNTIENGDVTPTESSHNNSSFFGFSPSQMGSRFIKSLGEQSKRFRPSRRHQRYNDEPVTPDRHSPRRQYFYNNRAAMEDQFYQQQQTPHQDQQPPQQALYSTQYDTQGGFSSSHFKEFWLNPSTPGLIALYLQVGFNMIMLGSLVYALAVFYLTIKNDVNLKVEEYAMDVVDQIAKCSHDYIRNNCEPSKRVPAMEAACQQWDRCMQRNPQEIGRAKVSAETFGMIIDAFFQPIGIKSMIFLVAGFAGSFLLVNGVFSSKIGPRFSGYSNGYGHIHPAQPAPPPPPPQPAQQIPASMYPQAQQSFVYTSQIHSPSHIATPRQPQPVRATLQSSPIRQHYVDYYD